MGKIRVVIIEDQPKGLHDLFGSYGFGDLREGQVAVGEDLEFTLVNDYRSTQGVEADVVVTDLNFPLEPQPDPEKESVANTFSDIYGCRVADRELPSDTVAFAGVLRVALRERGQDIWHELSAYPPTEFRGRQIFSKMSHYEWWLDAFLEGTQASQFVLNAVEEGGLPNGLRVLEDRQGQSVYLYIQDMGHAFTGLVAGVLLSRITVQELGVLIASAYYQIGEQLVEGYGLEQFGRIFLGSKDDPGNWERVISDALGCFV